MKRFTNKETCYGLLAALILVLADGVAYAEEGKPMMSEDDYIGDVPKVLTVSRLAQAAADVPSAVTVIDRETIRASGIVDLPEIFRLVPGMYVGANAGYVYNTNHTVSYHGMTTAYAGSMQVMINGRSVYSPLFGGVNWSELPIAIVDIERIEVTRGPNAASYGANSYFGVINIITQSPLETPNNSVIATHGSGRNEVFYRHAGKQDALNYRFTAGYRQDDGLDNRNDFKRTRFINTQADYRLGLNDALELEFGIADGARGEGNLANDALVFVPRTKQINNHYQLIRWRHHISDTSDFTLQAFHSYDKSDDETTSVNLRPILGPLLGSIIVSDNLTIDNTVVQQRADIEAQQTFALGKQIRAVWGASVRQDSVYAPNYLDSNKTDYFNLQRIFGHAEWRAHEKLTLNAGAMIEHNDFTGTDISPRLSFNFKPHPNHTFRIGSSSALRTPNYVEEKFRDRLVIPTVLLNPNTLIFQYRASPGNLAPERIISRELGYLGKVGRFELDARLFSDQIDDVIRDSDIIDFKVPANALLLNPLLNADVNGDVNRGGVRVEGLEFQAKWQLSRKTNLLVNHSYIHIRQTSAGLKREFDESAPRNTFSSLLTHRFNRDWDASLAYYQVSKANLLGDGDEIDLIRKSDLRIARKFKTGRWNGEVNMVIENLFNNHYEEFAEYNTFKRRGRVNVRLDF